MKRSILVVAILLLGSAVAHADDHGSTPLAATPIEADGTLLTACIEDAGDMDYFLFHASAGRTYRISTSHPTESMDSLLYLIDTDGQEILAIDNDSAGDTNARIVWTCHTSGVYFVMVRHAQATIGSGCYGLSVSVSQLDDHGNDRLSASTLADGVAVAGFLEESGDVDVFMTQMAPGYEYSIELSRPTSSEEAVTATVYQNGSQDPLAALRSQGRSQNETISLSISETLFITVQSDSPDHTGGYILQVTKGGYADDHANSAVSATPIPVEWSVIPGRIEVPGDVDWFRLSARSQAEYTFALTPVEASSGLRMVIRGPDGQLLHEAATGVSAEAVSIQWQAPEERIYYLEVSSTNGAGSYTLSISSTLQLQIVGSFNPSGYSLDVEAAEDMAYLIVGTKGLLVIDVSDPTDPFEVGSHSTNGYAQAVAIDGNTVYVANRSEGVTVLDVSDPARPAQLGTYDTPGSAHAILIHQGLAIVSDQRGGLQIARIQSGHTLSHLSSVDTKGYPAAVAAVGQLAYVAVGDAGLEIIDISTPESPVSIGHLDLPGDAGDIAVFDDLAFVATGYRGVRIVDVSDPTAPTEAGWISTAGEAMGVFISGSTLLVAEGTQGISAYSLTNPLEPQLVARVDTPGEATSVAAINEYVYVADRQEGMQLIELLP
ncbi:MAG: hypothetical protein E4H08_07465 [Candidatus Atribacteria bacterium]|nr:MAG: hypothetical protein E4H08_07465 [Candidatus Atribacteria bacterium]